MKKIISVLIICIIIIGVVGCSRLNENSDDDNKYSSVDYKIGIITGSLLQGEEEFLMAENMKSKYGEMILHLTYPDNFATEQETVVAQVVELANDPTIKAIIFVRAIPGTLEAIEKVRLLREDMLIIVGCVDEDARSVASIADICMDVDEINMGNTIVEQADNMGAKTLVHYSFERHLSYDIIAQRRDKLKENCEKLGLEFVEVSTPDPIEHLSDNMLQQFIHKDVAYQVAKYGTDTAFFATDCSMQEQLITSLIDQKAIFPQQCCPSVYHAYPDVLDIDTTMHETDYSWVLQEVATRVGQVGMSGRMASWAVPIKMLMIEGGVEYAIKYCEAKTDVKYHPIIFEDTLSNVVGDSYGITYNKYEDSYDRIDNFYLLSVDYYMF